MCSGIVPSGSNIEQKIAIFGPHRLNFATIPYWSWLDPEQHQELRAIRGSHLPRKGLRSLNILPAPSQRFPEPKGGHPVYGANSHLSILLR